MAYLRAFGHQAWSLRGSLEDRLIQDLLWRKVQTDRALVMNLAKLIDPNAKPDGNDIFLSSGTTISLHPDSCGAYSTQRNHRASCLHGNINDKQAILDAEQNPTSKGYYLGPLFQQKKGWLPENVCSNILRNMGMLLTQEDRYLFNLKACHNSALMSDRDKLHAQLAIENFSIDFGFKRFRVYWYSTENGSTAFGIVYFLDETGVITKLPISAWQRDANSDGNVVFDLLYPPHNCQLYDLHDLVRWHDMNKHVLICANEVTCETIKEDHAWIHKTIPVTTYSSVAVSDWSPIGSMKPIIFPDNSVDGCHEAFKVYIALQAQGLTPRFMKRLKKQHNRSDRIILAHDIYPIVTPDKCLDLYDFAKHCRDEFKVEILPGAIPLSKLPSSENEPELIMEGLLRIGDQMTIFAWRGVGKSMFALLLALCFANGHKALDGRVCPSRKYSVLLIDGEMPPSSLKKRARSITTGLGLPEEAAEEIMVRSSVVEKRDLLLDTDTGWRDLLPDIAKADIIIIDSLFKIFPSNMSNEISNVAALNNFYDWCRKNGKAAIVIDHQGKKGDTASGTMGKEMTVDAVLLLKKKNDKIEATATKNRNFESSPNCWVKYRMKMESGGMTFQPIGKEPTASSTNALPAGEDEGMKNSDDNISAPSKVDTDQAIIDYIAEHPDKAQGDIVKELMVQLHLGRSVLSARIKQLREGGQLEFWTNAPTKGKGGVISSAEIAPDQGDA
ncbi:MAG: AAA family ATPase [Desulfovibrio sp.]|uniref:AAA family ATPase n=1 Tax=Desulfovibrio sp. TaxID=885 RepID=UPI00135D7A56|nr:AAA family ATPase [Desulfovibrio sp.]MTJ93762.1 AAA family ATPase [Desulfovibrio sp.]